MQINKIRPMALADLDTMEIPTRNVQRYRDGGSWSAEVYLANRWAKMRHDFASNATTVDGELATVEISFRITNTVTLPDGLAVSDGETK